MNEITATELVERLRGRELRTRTAILLVQPEQMPDAANIAARLGIDAVDYCEELKTGLPSETRYVYIDAVTEMTRLDNIASANQGSGVVLIANLDLALAKLRSDERLRLWDDLRIRLPHRRRALLIAMPACAGHLLPRETDLAIWRKKQRLASL